MALFRDRRTNKVSDVKGPRVTMAPNSHAGRSGYSIYEDGKHVAWGSSPEAAKATYAIRKAG